MSEKETEYTPLTPDQIKSAKMQDAEFLRRGAEVNAEGQLTVTDPQLEGARTEMEDNLRARDLHKHFSSGEIAFLGEILNSLESDRGAQGIIRGSGGGQDIEERIKMLQSLKWRFNRSVIDMLKSEKEEEKRPGTTS